MTNMADWDMSAQVRRLLASNEPSPLRVAAAPEAGDPEQMQAQQIRLMALGTRTMALPFGRAALTLGRFLLLLTIPEMEDPDLTWVQRAVNGGCVGP